MWRAVIGDIAGSRFEGSRGGPKDFEMFHRLCTYTDDTVCTAAIAYIIVNDRKPDATLQRWCRRHPDRGYGGAFRRWIASDVPAHRTGASETAPPCEYPQSPSSTNDDLSKKRSPQAIG